MSTQERIDRTIRPTPLPLPRITIAPPGKAMLKNGLRIMVFEKHELPVISFTLVVGAGADHDDALLSGRASMTATLLDEGTRKRTALMIAEELDRLGVTLTIRTSHDAAYLSLYTLSRNLDTALDLFADVVLNATLPAEEFERQRARRLNSLLQQKDQPATVASKSFHRVIYGTAHPYGRDVLGTAESLRAITRDDAMDFYKTFFHPGNATLIVVGDTTLENATAYLNGFFGEWEAVETPSMAPPLAPPPLTRKVFMIDRPGAVQSEICIGYPALPRSTPDYFPVVAMNRVLGGQFSSRLNLNLREQRGITYGIHSGFNFQRYPGPFIASGAVNRDATDVALREIIHEIDTLHNDGVTTQELEFVKKGLTGNFVLGFETPSQIAGVLTTMSLYGLPDDYYLTYLQAVDAVSREDVGRACHDYLDSSTMALLFVGDLGVVRKAVEDTGLGEAVELTPDGEVTA